MGTEDFVAFKGIYIESTQEYYLCDFYRARDGGSYRILAELPGKGIQETRWIKEPLHGTLRCISKGEIAESLLVRQIKLHIELLEAI